LDESYWTISYQSQTAKHNNWPQKCYSTKIWINHRLWCIQASFETAIFV